MIPVFYFLFNTDKVKIHKQRKNKKSSTLTIKKYYECYILVNDLLLLT